MDLSALARQLPPDNEHARQQLDSINELVNSMLTSVRRIIEDLPPKLLDDAGLFDALRLLADNFEKRYGISCHLHLPEQQPLFADKIASTIYRIAQESLNNTAKHAGATRVDITVKKETSMLMLSVVDNGKGASRAELRKSRSFGLIGMRERATALNGELRVVTAPGTGMAVHVTLPAHESVISVKPTMHTTHAAS
jgi:signal transduction histidine kinase